MGGWRCHCKSQRHGPGARARERPPPSGPSLSVDSGPGPHSQRVTPGGLQGGPGWGGTRSQSARGRRGSHQARCSGERRPCPFRSSSPPAWGPRAQRCARHLGSAARRGLRSSKRRREGDCNLPVCSLAEAGILSLPRRETDLPFSVWPTAAPYSARHTGKRLETGPRVRGPRAHGATVGGARGCIFTPGLPSRSAWGVMGSAHRHRLTNPWSRPRGRDGQGLSFPGWRQRWHSRGTQQSPLQAP